MLNLKRVKLFQIRAGNVHKMVLQLDSSIYMKSSRKVCFCILGDKSMTNQSQVLVSLNPNKELKVQLQCDCPHTAVSLGLVGLTAKGYSICTSACETNKKQWVCLGKRHIQCEVVVCCATLLFLSLSETKSIMTYISALMVQMF